MSAVPGFIVIAYCSRSFVAEVGVATGGIGRSRWNGSNGVEDAERTNADVFLPLVALRASALKEQTRATPPKPRVSASRRLNPSLIGHLRRPGTPETRGRARGQRGSGSFRASLALEVDL